MDNLQALLDRSKIPFSKPLGQEQVEELLEYLANNSIEINYQIEIRGTISNNDPTKFLKYRYCSRISGGMVDMSLKKQKYTFSSFDCFVEPLKDVDEVDEEDEPMRFYGINFSVIPGYKLEEHSKEEIQLWDKTRELIQKYFSNKE